MLSYDGYCDDKYSMSKNIFLEKTHMIFQDNFETVGPLIWTTLNHLLQPGITQVQLVQTSPNISYVFVFGKISEGYFFRDTLYITMKSLYVTKNDHFLELHQDEVCLLVFLFRFIFAFSSGVSVCLFVRFYPHFLFVVFSVQEARSETLRNPPNVPTQTVLRPYDHFQARLAMAQ